VEEGVIFYENSEHTTQVYCYHFITSTATNLQTESKNLKFLSPSDATDTIPLENTKQQYQTVVVSGVHSNLSSK
jgi:hypothetical protein